jgi:hypothetical protein
MRGGERLRNSCRASARCVRSPARCQSLGPIEPATSCLQSPRRRPDSGPDPEFGRKRRKRVEDADRLATRSRRLALPSRFHAVDPTRAMAPAKLELLEPRDRDRQPGNRNAMSSPVAQTVLSQARPRAARSSRQGTETVQRSALFSDQRPRKPRVEIAVPLGHTAHLGSVNARPGNPRT